MAILDVFKKEEKEAKKAVKEKKPAKKKAAVSATPKSSTSAYRILKSPHISEKATALSEQNQYVFKVWPRAGKTEIKRAIEDLYKVEVIGTRIIKVPSKKKRIGRTMGIKKGYTKAIVSVKQGQKIEILAQ